MNQLMAQLMAERFGVNKDVLAALQAVESSSSESNGLSDPLMAALVSTMMQQKSASGDEAGEEEEIDYERLLAQAKRRIHQLKRQLAAAMAMVNYIAEVFGACPACWGQNKLCPQCRGRGAPGSERPMEEELLAWVEPALKALGMRAVRTEQ